MSETEVVEALLAYRRQNYQSQTDLLPIEVSDLVRSDPFAFLLGAGFNRRIHWKDAWEIPYSISLKGMLDPHKLATMDFTELEDLIKSLPVKPHSIKEGAQMVKSASTLVVEKYGGDASAIWRNASPNQVFDRVKRIIWIGDAIAAMIVLLLYYNWEGHLFRGKEQEINIKADVHLMRVFNRTGLTRYESDSGEAVSAARRLYPDFPGKLDWPAWTIGRDWCIHGVPNCSDCPLNEVCPFSRARAQMS